MTLALALVGLVLLALPGLAARAGRHLQPVEWSRLSLLAVWFGFRAIQLSFGLTAVPTVLGTLGLTSVADACHRVLGPAVPGGRVTGWAAALLFSAMTVRARQLRRRAIAAQQEARIERWLGDHRPMDTATLVVLPCAELLAYAAPGSPAQVVISEGLVDTLQPDELQAVIEHELAHLRHGHSRHLAFVEVVEGTLGWIPGAQATAAAIRLSVERCADEDACARVGIRDSVRRALQRVTETMLGPVPAFTAAWTISQRLVALAEDPPSPTVGQRLTVHVPVLALITVVVVSVALWSGYTHHSMLGIVGFCPL